MCLALVVLFTMALSACGGEADPQASYTPPYLPVKIVYSAKDGFSVQGERSFVTPVGIFSIGADYSVKEPGEDEILVILRNKRTGFDNIYRVRTGDDRFVVEVNGRTTIEIVNRQVVIDVTDGTIESVAFKRATESGVSEEGDDWFSENVGGWAEERRQTWDEGWADSWYKPYAMTRWAYDDSTIDKAYGLGFVWFLIRLVLAIVLGVIDTVLTFFFLLGQLAYLLAGPTARNILYGVVILVVLGFAVLVALDLAG